MTQRLLSYTCLLAILLVLCFGNQHGFAQTTSESVKGRVLESGTNQPLKQVVISVASTGETAETDATGAFTINVPDRKAELIIDLPGYTMRKVFIAGRDSVIVSMVQVKYKSFDNYYNNPLGNIVLKDAVTPMSMLTTADLNMTKSTSFDQALQGRAAGLFITEQSGMPGHKSWMNIRGLSSLYGRNEPLLFIDGMIHEYTYAENSLLEGFSTNPMEIVDIDDITDISILKSGESYLGNTASNGVIFVNTEQKSEASTIIKISAYNGISMIPNKLSLLDAPQFKQYFTDLLADQGFSTAQVNERYPWLNGGSTVSEYYRYNNNTDWQSEIYKPSRLQKYYIFLKGGDDIATYNISSGFVAHNGLYDESRYTRFNLRINGKINITKRFTIMPNAKLSLSDSYLPNQGFSDYKNPILSAVMKSPLMAANAKDEDTGEQLPYLDDVGAFNVSNPAAIVKKASGAVRNYHFLSSANAIYKFNEHFQFSTLVGINFNNARENLFLPDIGLVQVDSAANSPGDFVNEYRSAQNHTTFTYTTHTANGHSLDINAGLRYMSNTYKFNKALDLNTPSDDFKNLGQGSKYNYLRRSYGDDRSLIWVSYFGNANYSFRNQYFINANLSYDGSSVVSETNRYNMYPSVAVAWRPSAGQLLSQMKWLEDLKLRASWSQSGNMFSDVYDFSKLYYVTQRMNNLGVVLREAIPNDNLEIEKKTTINTGLDLSLFKQAVNLHVDYYRSNVDNLVLMQDLPPTYGYTAYFDNGGKLETSGLEVAADFRLHFGALSWIIGGSVTQQVSEIKELTFIAQDVDKVLTSVESADFVTSVGNPMNAYYGYKTNGIYTSADEAAQVTGPKGMPMQAGDIRFVDLDNNKIINELDKTIIGDPNPDLFGGVNTSLMYKRIEVSALFTYCVGNDIYNYVRYKGEAMDSYGNQFAEVANRWKPGSTNAELPRASFGDPTGNTVFSDRWIEDGSYFRLKQLTVSYNLPPVTGLYKGITLYLTATNLLTFTKYSGYDPEFYYLNNPFYMGIDYGKIPITRSVIIGVKLDL